MSHNCKSTKKKKEVGGERPGPFSSSEKGIQKKKKKKEREKRFLRNLYGLDSVM